MIYYEVWGYDTFAHEDYSCGRYTTYREAEKVLKEQEADVEKTQDEALRDTFSIVKITDEGIKLRDEQEKQIRYIREKEQSYSHARLTECSMILLTRLQEILSTIKKEDLLALQEKDECQTHKVHWSNEKDCFEQLSFELFYKDNDRFFVSIGIKVKDGEYSSGGMITSCGEYRGTREELTKWAKTNKAVKQCVQRFEELIQEIYRD